MVRGFLNPCKFCCGSLLMRLINKEAIPQKTQFFIEGANEV